MSHHSKAQVCKCGHKRQEHGANASGCTRCDCKNFQHKGKPKVNKPTISYLRSPSNAG